MNSTHPGTINIKAVLAIMAFTLVVAALFGSPTSSVPSVPDVASQVAGR
ncbi:MAG TPA: hypothetical protein VK903_11785 [Propionicimonas sp.]|nr:hypothetical protein [Propionicimonas sp.]